jgi:hypothetical protein
VSANEEILTDDLTSKQVNAIAALLVSGTIQSAATRAEVSESTLHRWLEQPTFVAALHKAQEQAIMLAAARLAEASDTAVSVLINTMTDPKVAPTARVKAAASVLRWLVEFRQLTIAKEERALSKSQLVVIDNAGHVYGDAGDLSEED